MFNLLEPESGGLLPTSADPAMAGINGLELVNGLQFANNMEFSAESANIERLMPPIENGSGVYDPTTIGEIDILTGSNAEGTESATREASAINPNAEEVHRFWDEQTQSHFFTADEQYKLHIKSVCSVNKRLRL